MKKFGFMLGLVLSAALLVLLFYQLDLASFSAAFRSINYLFIPPILFLVFFGVYLRALRWQWLIRPVKRIPVYDLFVATIIGSAGNTLLPARAGEFLRAHAIGRLGQVSRATAFATIVVERLFDGLSILLVLAGVSFWLKIPQQNILLAASWAALALYLAVIALIMLINYKKEIAVKLLTGGFFFLPVKLKQNSLNILGSLAEGFKVIEHWYYLLIIALYSFLIWGIGAVGIYLTVAAFGPQLSFAAALFILVLLTFAVIIPSSPGFVGTLDAGLTYGLMFFSVPKETALAAAIFSHVISFVPVAVLGLYYLWRYKLS